jgi:hypothetical protein
MGLPGRSRKPEVGARRERANSGILSPMIQGPDDDLEREFPLGDGTAETSTVVSCPYCGEAMEIVLDPGGGPVQHYVEDCQVCCQPWRVSVRYGEDGRVDVSVAALDE